MLEELTSGNHEEWTAIFDEVLFPLILRLLKPEVYSSDPIGMSETRVQAATLLCKIFLHYLVLLSKWDGMLDLWLKILDIMDRLMNSGQGDSLVWPTFFLFGSAANGICRKKQSLKVLRTSYSSCRAADTSFRQAKTQPKKSFG